MLLEASKWRGANGGEAIDDFEAEQEWRDNRFLPDFGIEGASCIKRDDSSS